MLGRRFVVKTCFQAEKQAPIAASEFLTANSARYRQLFAGPEVVFAGPEVKIEQSKPV